MALFFRNSQRSFLAAPVLLSLALAASLATAQEPLPPIQFNAPYRCADATTYVIERCVSARLSAPWPGYPWRLFRFWRLCC